MKVWIGLPHVEIAWMLQNENSLEHLLLTSRKVSDEIFHRYGSHPCFHGWYIPYELCNVFVTWDGDESRLPRWVNGMAEYCKSISSGKPAAVAPYFTTVSGVQEFARVWEKIFTLLDSVDVIAMQDSVGIFKENRLRNLPAYFSILHELAQTANKELWCDIEVFDQRTGIPLDEERWTAECPSCERIVEQIETVAGFVEKIVTFSFCDYMNPTASPEAQALYEAYKQYASRKTARLPRPTD